MEKKSQFLSIFVQSREIEEKWPNGYEQGHGGSKEERLKKTTTIDEVQERSEKVRGLVTFWGKEGKD